MPFAPNSQPNQQEAVPEVQEALSVKEAEVFFSSLSCMEFRSDVREMVVASNLTPERQHEILAKVEELYTLLGRGFSLDNLKYLFMKGVDIDINNEDEKDLYNYFIFGIKSLYKNFRMMHQVEAGGVEK